MAAVDPVYAQWLQADGLWHVESDAVLLARWGTQVLTTLRLTTLATRVDAAAEAARQIDFMGYPLAVEEHTLPGQWAAYLGRVITVTIDRLGYDAGLDVFVIAAEDNRASGLSKVSVIRRL